jgi:glycosyltransferase involved in cell wall biosynthesis
MTLVTKVPKVAIVIPAFNEEEAINKVVIGSSAFGAAVVVNDGSTDNTERVARAAGALVISHEVNRGYDIALATGLEKALEDQFDFAITFDGDGQHAPSLIRYFLFELMEGADIVIGIRGSHQRISETIFAKLSKILWGISDPLCGMKGYRLSKLKGIDSLCSYPSIGTELAIRAVRSGWNIRQVSVNTLDRNGRSRFGAGLYANSLILWAMLLGIFLAKPYISDPKVGIQSS